MLQGINGKDIICVDTHNDTAFKQIYLNHCGCWSAGTRFSCWGFYRQWTMFDNL